MPLLVALRMTAQIQVVRFHCEATHGTSMRTGSHGSEHSLSADLSQMNHRGAAEGIMYTSEDTSHVTEVHADSASPAKLSENFSVASSSHASAAPNTPLRRHLQADIEMLDLAPVSPGCRHTAAAAPPVITQGIVAPKMVDKDMRQAASEDDFKEATQNHNAGAHADQQHLQLCAADQIQNCAASLILSS
jgi:hypothetical protein